MAPQAIRHDLEGLLIAIKDGLDLGVFDHTGRTNFSGLADFWMHSRLQACHSRGSFGYEEARSSVREYHALGLYPLSDSALDPHPSQTKMTIMPTASRE